MTITPLNVVIEYNDKHSLVKALLYLKLIQKRISITDNELNILAIFCEKNKTDEAIEEAIEKKYFMSYNSASNAITALVNAGILKKVGTKLRVIDESILPRIESDYVAATYKIHNINVN